MRPGLWSFVMTGTEQEWPGGRCPSLLQLVCPDCQVTRLLAPSSIGQWVHADLPTPHRPGGPAPPEHLWRGPPFPTHSQPGLAGWPGPCIRTGCPEHQLSRLPSASVGSPWAAGWGACSGRGSSQGQPRDPGLEPPSPPKLGTRAPRTGPQLLWTPRAGPALLRTDGPHPHFLLSNKKHSFVPKVGPEVSQSPVSCQA